jgi:nucleotide-binding universal stress UspA family protein
MDKMAEAPIIVALELKSATRDRQIIESARAFAGPTAELRLVHVHQLRQTTLMDFSYVEKPAQLAKELSTLTAALEAIRAEVPGPTSVDVAVGHPPEVLVGFSKSARLVVVGRAHSSLVDRVLAGSVESQLVHGAACPVLVVP